MAIKLVRPARNSRRTVLPLAAGLNIFSSMPMISSSCCRTARPRYRVVLRRGSSPHAVKRLSGLPFAARPLTAIAPGFHPGLRPDLHLNPRPDGLPIHSQHSVYLIKNTGKSLSFAACSQCCPAARAVVHAAGQTAYPKKARMPVKITCAAMAASNSPVSLHSTAMPVLCRARATPSAMRSSTNMPQAATSSENTPTST